MNDLDKYRHRQPFDVSDEEIDHLVDTVTERAIEHQRGKHPTLRRISWWTTAAAAIVLAAIVALHPANKNSDSKSLVLEQEILAENTTDTTISDEYLLPDVDVIDNEQTVAQADLSTDDEPVDESQTTTTPDDMSEVDELLCELTDAELQDIDSYYIDEIPEY